MSRVKKLKKVIIKVPSNQKLAQSQEKYAEKQPKMKELSSKLPKIAKIVSLALDKMLEIA